jgi:hypothetical protein
MYPGARLTQAILTPSFANHGKATWGMVWKTFDGADEVHAYYMASLARAGWVVAISGRPNGSYSEIFNSRSSSNSGGMLDVVVIDRITNIGLALTVD